MIVNKGFRSTDTILQITEKELRQIERDWERIGYLAGKLDARNEEVDRIVALYRPVRQRKAPHDRPHPRPL